MSLARRFCEVVLGVLEPESGCCTGRLSRRDGDREREPRPKLEEVSCASLAAGLDGGEGDWPRYSSSVSMASRIMSSERLKEESKVERRREGGQAKECGGAC